MGCPHTPLPLFCFPSLSSAMSTPAPDVSELQAAVDASAAAVNQQADAVRALKAKAKEGNADKVRTERGGADRRRARGEKERAAWTEGAWDAAHSSRRMTWTRSAHSQRCMWSAGSTAAPQESTTSPPPAARPSPPPLPTPAPLSSHQAAVDAQIARLKDLKLSAETAQAAYEAVAGRTSASSAEAFRAAVANALERRLFYLPSFKIYGAVAGFYDYGPPGCAVKANITQAWRAHFVLEEGMLEVECPAVTPEAVLRASGHVDRFTDLMVSDTVTGDCHRADHLLEEALERALADTAKPLTPHQREEARTLLATVEELTADGLGEALARYSVAAPDTGNALSKPYAFNLMFKTSIGPRGDAVGYLRPETAQGIFVNFKDLLYFNGNRLPFAAAQIGQSYRNEINPRAGLLRVREFTQAEIEHFCNPDDKAHPKFAGAIAALTPLLFSRALQMGEAKVAEPMALGEAVAAGIIANETLAYFIGRTWLFFTKVTERGRGRERQERWGWKIGRENNPPTHPLSLFLSLSLSLSLFSSLSFSGRHRPGPPALPPAPGPRDGALRGGLLGRGGPDLVRLDRVRGPGRPVCLRPDCPRSRDEGRPHRL